MVCIAITFWRVVLFYRLDGGVYGNNFLVSCFVL